MSNKSFYSTLCLVTVSIFVGIYGYNHDWFGSNRTKNIVSSSLHEESAPNNGERRIQSVPLKEALGLKPMDELIEVGGILRPSRDMLNLNPKVSKQKLDLPKYGKAPQLKGDENPIITAFYKELKNGTAPPAAKSAIFKPEKPFDRYQYLKDPKSYLTKIRPGRIYQTAEPSPTVQRISPRSKTFNRLIQGESVTLEVKAEPNMPVVFYTPGVGEFPNRLTTYNVAADDDGVARATYKATRGTKGIIDILASSPVMSDQVKFVVNVSLPK